MKYLLIVVGLLALIAWAIPSLVVLGFFLIIPGMVLAVAPTVFVYLLTAYLIGLALPWKAAWKTAVAAGAGALLLGWAVNAPGRWVEMGRYEALMEPEIVPAEPLAIGGSVLLERHERRPRDEPPPLCAHVCAALLDTPGVTSVTAGPEQGRRRLRLVRDDALEGLRPQAPGVILDVFGRLDLRRGLQPEERGAVALHEARERRRERLNANWAFRLSMDEAIVEEAPAGAPAWTIRIVDRTIPRTEPRLQRLEALDGAGEVRLRRSVLKHSVPTRFLHFDLTGGMTNPHFVRARELVSNVARYEELDAEVELLLHARVARPEAPEDADGALRRLTAAATGDSQAGEKRLAGVREWVRRLDADEAALHEGLLARVVADLRVGELASVLAELYPKRTPAALRGGLVARVLRPGASAEERQTYAQLLARMPAGTFAAPTEGELRVWTDPELRLEASPFLERAADQGTPGVELLLDALRDAVAMEHWHERRLLVGDLRKGFARLGPAGSAALPYLRELVAARPSPVLQSAKDGLAWRTTLAVMGMPVEELPLPESFSAAQAAKYRERVRRAVADFRPDE